MSSTKTVLVISSSYPQSFKDWKSIFIRQLINALSANFEFTISYWGPPGPLPRNVSYECLPQDEAWLSKLMEQGGIIHLFRQGGMKSFLAPAKFFLSLKRTYKRHKNIDLYHINWLQNAIPLWGTKQPAVISVLGSDLGLLKLPGMTWLLRQVLKKRKCVLAPNAGWMTDILEKKFGDVTRVISIPLGIDKEWYELKRNYENTTPRKWLVVSRLTQKKIGPLLAWGEKLFNKGRGHQLHLFGPMQEDIALPEWVFYHGPTHAKDLMENWFSKAAGLVTLSQHDEGRPQVMLEAMAAGLPIIASRIPAHENFITHRETGWLTSSIQDFVEGVDWLSVLKNSKTIGSQAQTWVRREVGTWTDCANRYLQVYANLLEKA
jgi:glycosyltransferase involved in cell wall biosynthesis